MTTDELLQRWSDGSITADELRELTANLAEPEHQSALLDDWLLESSLPDRLPGASVAGLHELAMNTKAGRRASEGGKRWTGWLSWRPLTAAAAGIVFGMFCTSVVYGFVSQRHISAQTLLTEGFEDGAMVRDHGVPSRAGVWSGDLETPQGEAGELKPAEGLRMVMLPPVEKRKFSYVFRFVDLTSQPPVSAGQTREIEVTAQFHGTDQRTKDRFQIRLAAFAEDVAAAREIWVRDHVDEQALMHVVKTAKRSADDRGWTTVRSTMDVPANARLVLVSLAACVTDSEPSKTPHYLDDVHIRLITHQALP